MKFGFKKDTSSGLLDESDPPLNLDPHPSLHLLALENTSCYVILSNSLIPTWMELHWKYIIIQVLIPLCRAA